MELLKRLDEYASVRGEQIAFQNEYSSSAVITYKELKEYSDRIAYYIRENICDDGSPIIVYGHKNPLMLVAFLGCVKAHHPYCPVDISMPDERVKDIVELSAAKMMFSLEPIELSIEKKISTDEIKEIILSDAEIVECRDSYVDGEDTFYIIFTSGSTGKPKGVQITANCLDNFLDWMEQIRKDGMLASGNVYLNQAPFSFDLSVMDVYTSLYTGGTIWALDKRMQENMEDMYSKMQDSKLNVWVSTPSFVNVCLINRNFNQEMLPDLHTFLFCGEVLTNKTVVELHKRFPKAQVINTYGPTESTVAVTEVLITEEMAKSNTPLSIGMAKPGTDIYILNDTYKWPPVSEGEKGEIIICGDTVAKGYLNQPQLTNEKFFVLETPMGKIRAYKTGDVGYYKNGLLYYMGRMDFQLKINGYRIELGDIESNILKSDNILYCVVLPIVKNGENKGLAAFVTTKVNVEDEFAYAQEIRKKLMEQLPKYMIPKKFVFLDEMPMTNNGKADRRELEKMI